MYQHQRAVLAQQRLSRHPAQRQLLPVLQLQLPPVKQQQPVRQLQPQVIDVSYLTNIGLERATQNFSGTILRWNTTGVIVAGTGIVGITASQLNSPQGIYIDSNDVLYVCDYNNHRIQKWIIGETNGSTVAGDSGASSGSGPSDLRRPIDVTIDHNDYMYVVDYGNHRVQKFAPNSTIGVTAAGTGNAGKSINQLRDPAGIAIDEYLNLYITDSANERVMKWSPNATAGTIVASSNTLEDSYGIIVKHGFPDQMYISDTQRDTVQLWSAGATQPNQTLAGIASLDLRGPRAMRFDLYDNLYVANFYGRDIRKFCAGSTTPIVVIDSISTTPLLIAPVGIAFDSNYNLYVSDYSRHYVLKYSRL